MTANAVHRMKACDKCIAICSTTWLSDFQNRYLVSPVKL